MKLIYTEKFKKDYKKLSLPLQRTVEQKLLLLVKDIFHPSLGVKKVRKYKGIFEGRVNKNFRFLFEVIPGSYILLRVKKHDILEKQ